MYNENTHIYFQHELRNEVVKMIMGHTYETLYFYALLISGGLTILYAIIGGVFDFDVDGVISPIFLLSFAAFASAFGFILEVYTSLSSLVVFIVALGVALLLSILSNHFIFIPVKKAQESLVFEEKSLEGTVATVITTIPVDGFGEILIKSTTGSISKTATSVKGEEIEAGSTVMVFEIKDRVAQVIPYKPLSLS